MADNWFSCVLFHQGAISPWSIQITSFFLTLLGVALGQTLSREALCTSPQMRGGRIFLKEVPEDLPVGATVGNLQLFGSSSQISLSYIDPRNLNIDFDPGSQNLTVRRPLDRESYDYIDIKVECEMIDTGFKVSRSSLTHSLTHSLIHSLAVCVCVVCVWLYMYVFA
ncbi:hypothetical protein LSH36_64g02042 [Paralvinella palmiformis]|uniref:Uncharacterized protein n=1 Tax=Paralvinella palmiformis TaxID=53620 RepID=A0AAD9K3U3_9ANNE|nr:hypothetical protein LSH36_64g02042 [Paralvinella palmiformis]